MRYFGIHGVPADGVLVYHIDTDPLSLDPARCHDYVGQLLLRALYQPLIVRSQRTGRLILGAANRYEVSEGGLVHTFWMRKDARWSNGTAVRAHDFEFAFKRLADPAVDSPFSALVTAFENGSEVISGKFSSAHLGVTALGDRILEIRLSQPIQHLGAALSSPCFSPLPGQSTAPPASEWTPMVTNGPFVLSDYSPVRGLALAPNKHLRPVRSGVAGVRFWVSDDLDAPLEAYAEGSVHITCDSWFPFQRIAELSGYADYHQNPSSILYLLFCERQMCPPLRDVRVRRALYHAIDKEKIARLLYGGVIPWDHYIAAGVAGELFRTAERSRSYEPELARELWRQAGYDVRPWLFPELKVLFADYYPNREIIEELQLMWRSTLGLRTDREPVTFGEFDRRLGQEAYELCLVLMTPTYPHPASFLECFLCEVEDGQAEPLGALLRRGQNNVDEASSAYCQADELLQEALPALPLFSGQSIYLRKPEVRGYRPFPDGAASFNNLRFVSVK